MKIFLISNMYPSKNNPSFGVFVKKITDGLEIQGSFFPVKAIIRGRPASLLSYVPAYAKFFLLGIFGLFKPFDIIYCHFVLHSAPLALIVKFFSRKPLVVNIHGTDLLGKGITEKVLSPFRKALLNKANLIVVPSEDFKKRAIKHTGLKEKDFFVSPSGGIAKQIQNSSKSRNNDKLIIGYVGRITKSKGVYLLLDVAKYLRKQLKDKSFKIVLAGDGPDLTLLLSMAYEMGISANIDYLGHFTQTELSDVYEKIDILIFPTLLEESLGLVGLEAMSYSKPIIASKIGGITDYLVDKKNGFAVTPNDANAICDKLQEIIDKPEMLEKLGHNAFSTAEQYFDSEISVKLYKKLNDILREHTQCKLINS